MDMERFHIYFEPTWCHFSFFLNFIPLYNFLIYGVFFNKALQDFDEQSSLKGLNQIWLHVREKNSFFFKSHYVLAIYKTYNMLMGIATCLSLKCDKFGVFSPKTFVCRSHKPFSFVISGEILTT
jgi:hypothetical protein